ncbi:MAG: DNA polymerase III subunit gamma/tau, partial [Parcubacteria group bacterium]
MALALYRKYRPQRFVDVIGQRRVVKTLQQALVQDRIAHAYLFAGPRGTGKTTVARLLARALNCQAVRNGKLSTGEPCNACEACKRAAQGRELDLLEIDAASNRGIDEIRELRERVRFAPTAGRKKVFLIDEIHMLTKEAFNALLKTLEEPPEHAIFVLATTELHSIPATILSRAQQFTFRTLTTTDLVKICHSVAQAEGLVLEVSAAQLIAALAEGGARDALSLLDVIASAAGGTRITEQLVREVLALPPQEQYEQWVAAIAQRDANKAVTLLQESYQAGHDPVHLAKGLVRYLRLIMLSYLDVKLVDQAAAHLTSEQRAYVLKLAEELPQGVVLRAVTLLNRAVGELRLSALPLLPLEVASLEIVALLGGPTRHDQTKPRRVAAPQSVEAAKPETQKPQTTLANTLEPVDEEFMRTLLSGWSQALANVRSKNLGIGSLLKSAVLLRVTKTQAWFVVEYSFHRERILMRQNRQLIEETLLQQFG